MWLQSSPPSHLQLFKLYRNYSSSDGSANLQNNELHKWWLFYATKIWSGLLSSNRKLKQDSNSDIEDH
jgi:hypothetical protein